MTAQTARTNTKPIIIDPEHTMHKKLSHSEHFVFRIDASMKDRLRDTFLVLRSSTLNKYAELLIRSMKNLSKLRVVFVLMDTGFDTFFDKVTELKVNSLLSKIFKVDSPEQIDRVLHMWCNGLQKQRFAEARVEGSTLIAKACDLTKYEIDLAGLPVFCHLDFGKLHQPVIDQTSTRLVWKKHGVDIDFDTVRYHTEPKYKLELDLAALRYYSHYGDAVRKLREQMHLTQEVIADKTGVSTRHLSRIENSEQKPTVKLINKLAGAHNLSFDQYTKRLINICADIETAAIDRKRCSSEK